MWRKIETFPCYRVFHADSSAFLIVILKLDFFNDEKLCLKYNYRVVTRYVGSWIKGVGSGIRSLGSGIKGGEGSTLFRRRLRCGLQSYIETEGET